MGIPMSSYSTPVSQSPAQPPAKPQQQQLPRVGAAMCLNDGEPADAGNSYEAGQSSPAPQRAHHHACTESCTTSCWADAYRAPGNRRRPRPYGLRRRTRRDGGERPLAPLPTYQAQQYQTRSAPRRSRNRPAIRPAAIYRSSVTQERNTARSRAGRPIRPATRKRQA